MAFIKFCIMDIETNLKDKRVIIHFSKEIDTDTVDLQNFIIAAQDPSIPSMPKISLEISDDLKAVFMTFEDTPFVNTRYILIVQNTVKDLEGRKLDQSLFRNIYFKSTVISSISLLSPGNFEVISEKTFSWKETGDTLINVFRVQISTDTAFHNVQVNSTVSGKETVTFGKELSVGQYYWRVRPEQDLENYGSWSDIRTFMIGGQSDSSAEISDETSETSVTEIEIEDHVMDIKNNSLKIISMPKNGETPATFTFMFDEDIDSDSIKISILKNSV